MAIKKLLKGLFIKGISIIFLIILGCIFFISIPKIFSMAIIKTVEFLDDSTNQNTNGEVVYQDGRKTIQSFGSRKEFVILRGVEVDEQGNINKEHARWSLYDRDKNQDIDYDIRTYIHESPYVYTIGERGYTKLNYETAEIKQYKDIDAFSMEDKEIFYMLKQGQGPQKYFICIN